MSRSDNRYKNEKNAFICVKCGMGVVSPESGTSNRNHCPECLWSLHVDLRTGDRMSICRGMMEPISVWAREDNEWSLIHRCVKCGFIRTNRIAADDSSAQLLMLALRPVIGLQFPSGLVNGEQLHFQNLRGGK